MVDGRRCAHLCQCPGLGSSFVHLGENSFVHQGEENSFVRLGEESAFFHRGEEGSAWRMYVRVKVTP